MSCESSEWSNDIRYIALNAEKIPELGGIYKVLRNDGEPGKLTRVYVVRRLI